MKTAAQLLEEKAPHIWSVSPDTSVYEGLKLMADKNIGALLVLEENRLIGIFSERDYARKVILKGKSSRDMLIKEIMTTSVTTVGPGEPIDACMSLMTQRHIRHLPIIMDGNLLGIISVTDVVRAIIEEQRHIIEQLESYIAERRRNAETLQRRESELRAILETAVDGIITIDEGGSIDSFNPAAARIFGYSADEVRGQNVSILMCEHDQRHHDDYISNYLGTGQRRIIGIGREVVGKRKDGTTFPLYVAVSEQQPGGRIRFTGIVRDLTDFKRMQKKVFQAENLAAIGEMAASVAHEIKNPLAGIGGAIQILQESMSPEDPRRSVMQEILGQVDRLDKTVRQLLMLSKPWKPDKQLCNLRNLLDRVTVAAAKQHAFSSVDFQFQGEEGVVALVDPSLMEQVIWNLLNNSVDAMPQGGQITFRLDERPDATTISVSDTGSGVPPDHQRKLFRPFFTTKTRGTGLGLSICKKIIDAHEGSIEVSSQVGRGTTVTLVLPRQL